MLLFGRPRQQAHPLHQEVEKPKGSNHITFFFVACCLLPPTSLVFPPDPFNHRDYPPSLTLKYVRLHYYIPCARPVVFLEASLFCEGVVCSQACFHKSFVHFFSNVIVQREERHTSSDTEHTSESDSAITPIRQKNTWTCLLLCRHGAFSQEDN